MVCPNLGLLADRYNWLTRIEHESEGEPLEKVLLENDSILVRTAAFDAYRVRKKNALLGLPSVLTLPVAAK